MTEREVSACADRFWHLAGELEPFPRSLEAPVAYALPLAIVKLPRLWPGTVKQWFDERGVAIAVPFRERPLRACLVARHGAGVVFLDGTDPPAERRLSLAHETAHFLADYLLPRERALSAFGPAIRDVLDGTRAPSDAERLHGALRGVELGVFAHLMDRSTDGQVRLRRARDAEDRADRLALELLAPADAVLDRARRARPRAAEWDDAFLAGLLVDGFGLPPDAAARYGRTLVSRARGARSFRAWLGR